MAEEKTPILFRYRVLWHILFWIVCYLTYTLIYGGYWGNYYKEEAWLNLLLFPVRIFVVYSMIYYLIPKFLLKRKYFLFFVTVLFHALFLGFGIWYTLYFFGSIEGYTNYKEYPLIYPHKIFNSMLSNYTLPLSAAFVKLFKWWYLDQQYKKELEKEKLGAELKFLKAQIHPHFLFNTLNNLYALTLKRSKTSSDIVLRLSELLDYMLYQSNETEVQLDKELEIIKGYVELEKIRYNDRLDLHFRIEGDSSQKKIAPLILLPFVENSFKHGASKDPAKPKIKILIQIEDTCLKMDVVNNIPDSKKKENYYSEGLGLKNVRRRLELIYPDRHELTLRKQESEFLVQLIIQWTNNY
ncbi:MAG: histidine kinase [Bacteroidales bacterium]|nr:histidine kinase [Bacteroidales bacterium]